MKISKSKIFASGLFAIMLNVVSTSSIQAAEEAKKNKIGPAEITYNAGYTSNYLWRGMTQNDNSGAASIGTDVALPGGFYLGAWTSAASGTNYTQEVDYYGGITHSAGPATFDVGYIAYVYPGTDAGASNFGEFYGKVTLAPEKAPYTAKVSYFVDDRERLTFKNYLEGSVSYDAGVVGINYTYGDYDKSNKFWSVGLSKELLGLGVTLAYTDTNFDAAGTVDTEKVTLSVAKTF